MLTDVWTVVHGEYGHSYTIHLFLIAEDSLCNELLFMVLSYCDITTLLFLYDDPVWHHLVVDILRKSHGELLRTSEIRGASFDGVIGHILTLNFEER